MLIYMIFPYFMSSPFLYVFGDDCVILYTRANDATGDADDT